MKTGRSPDCLSQFLKRHLGVIYARRRFLWGAELSYESVSMPYHRLQILRLRRIVFQRHANLADGRIDAHFDVNKYVFPPESVGDLFPRHQFAVTLDQIHEKAQGKTFEPYWLPSTKELEAAEVQLEVSEAEFLFWHPNPSPDLLQFLLSPSALSRSG